MPDFYVVEEDGEGLKVTASDPSDAANKALEAWGLVADPGYEFKVFRAEDAQPFKVALHMVALEGSRGPEEGSHD